MDEETFWNTTLRKIDSLIKEHNKYECPEPPEEKVLRGSDAINALMGLAGKI